MNGSAVTLDKVEIQISASAGKASENISHLTETLSALRSATKGGFNNLSKLAESLEELKSASSDLKTVKENISSLTDLTSSLKQLSDLPSPRGLGKIIENIQNIPSAFGKIDTKSIENIARVSNQLNDALTPLADKLGTIASGYSAVSKLADTYGVSVTKVKEYTKQSTNHTKYLTTAMNTLGKQFKSLQKTNENFFKNLSRNTSSIISKIKQIGLSLLGTRTIFTATRKAVSEYMNMDAELTWKITNNWRALGAQLAPAIENVTWLFKQFIRVVYSVILALTGIDLIARANEKAMKGWGKSAKDTLGNLQKFDDLNVVEFPKGKGDEDSLIKLDKIDLSPIQKVIDWVRKLRDEIKEAWNSGQWEGVGVVLAEGLNGAMKAINFDYIEERFKKISNKFGDFLHGVVDNFDWSTFGTQLTRQLSLIPRMITTFFNSISWDEIGKGLNEALITFDPKFLIDSIFGAMGSFINSLQQMLSQIDGKVVGKKISDGIISVLSNIRTILDKINWEDLGKKIREIILNIDWKNVFGQIVGILGQVLMGIGETIRAIFGAKSKDDDGNNLAVGLGVVGLVVILPTVIGLVKKLSDAKKTLTSGTSFTEFFTEIGEGLNHLMTLGGVALVLGSFALVLESVTNLLQTFAKTGLSVGEVVGIMLAVFTPVVALMAAVKYLGPGMTAGLAPFSILMLEIAAILGVVAITLPVILDAAADFIERVAPQLNTVLNAIGDNISKIIKALGTVLPPIVRSIGTLFTTIFNGISKVVTTIGDTIVRILGAVGKLAETIFNAIINFINRLGPAVNNLVDNLIKAITKLINFVVSGIEFMVNGIIRGINGLTSGLRKIGNKLFDIIGVDVKIQPISEVYLQRFAPKLETGTNEVPYEGLYHLHPGESVVPKKYNPALGGGTNAETNERLDRLISILENMDTTTIVNIGNKELLKQQQKFNKSQNDKYGTDIRF